MDCALAAITAARSRAFISGSGRPILAATVISRDSLENRFERFLSCAPLRYMMFLYLEWPAMAGPLSQAERGAIGVEQRVHLLTRVRLHFPQTDDRPHRLGVVAARFGFRIDVANIVGHRLFLFLEPLDALDE